MCHNNYESWLKIEKQKQTNWDWILLQSGELLILGFQWQLSRFWQFFFSSTGTSKVLLQPLAKDSMKVLIGYLIILVQTRDDASQGFLWHSYQSNSDFIQFGGIKFGWHCKVNRSVLWKPLREEVHNSSQHLVLNFSIRYAKIIQSVLFWGRCPSCTQEKNPITNSSEANKIVLL